MFSGGTEVSQSPSSLPVIKKSGETRNYRSPYLNLSFCTVGMSRQSGTPGSRSSLTRHVPLPPIPAPSTAPTDAQLPNAEERRNPFVMPPENELFTLRQRQREQTKKQRAEQRKLKVHEKSTYSSRLNTKNASLRKKVSATKSHIEELHRISNMLLQVMSPPESGRRDQEKGERGVSEDTDFVLTTTRDRHFEKEDITSYVNRKREMFLVQYALGVKREEIQKLEDIARVSPLCVGRI